MGPTNLEYTKILCLLGVVSFHCFIAASATMPRERGPERSPAVRNFQNFLESRMSAYNSWAEQQFLNAPYKVQTPYISIPNLESTLFNLSVNFTDMTVTNGLVSDDASFENVYGNILDGEVTIDVDVPSVSITGSYQANGVINGSAVSTTGTMKLDCGLSVRYEISFEVNSGGYVSTLVSSVYGSAQYLLSDRSINMTMGGLFAGNEDQYVQEMILWRIGLSLADQLASTEASLAMKEPFDTFLYPQFEETSVAEIIRNQELVGIHQNDGSTPPPVSKALRFGVSGPLLMIVAVILVFPTLQSF